MSHAPITFRDVTVAYDRHPAVHHVSGQFDAGTMTAIAGPNGGGKSTLVKALMGEVSLAGGTIDRGGLSVRDFGYLPQASEIERRFPLTVADTVMLGAWQKIGAFRGVSREIAEKARRALCAVGLEGFENRHIGSLSVGQFQRVLFARLLMQDARVFVLDEPFAAVDARTTSELMAIVCRWRDDGRTVIAILHDFEQIRASFPQTLLLTREAIDWGPTDTALSPSNLLRARAMSEQWDRNAPVCRDQGQMRA